MFLSPKKISPSNKLGFTLIELLVVISIIGFLSTIAIFSAQQLRIKVRDTKRVTDLRAISQALEFYYDNNGGYPVYSDGAAKYLLPNGYTVNWYDLEGKLSPYIKKLPIEPLYPDYPLSYTYWSQNSGKGYVIFMKPENYSSIGAGMGCMEGPGRDYYCIGNNWQ